VIPDEQLLAQAVERLRLWLNAHPYENEVVVDGVTTDRQWVVAIYRLLRFTPTVLPRGDERARLMLFVHLVLDDVRLDADA
jgi:hypothetical protein